jgi:hypothetical protein
VSDVE